MTLLDVARTTRRPAVSAVPAAAVELGLLISLFLLYRAGRAAVADQYAAAAANAGAVHRFEQWLHLPSEATLQAAVPQWLLQVANGYYVGVHFPLMIAFLVWGWHRRPRAEYRWARNLLLTLTGAALVVHVAFPLAPPRMFPDWGFVDTMAVFGPNAYAGASGGSVNQLAAMPSLHVGWALLIAYVVARTASRRLAALAGAHVVVTVLVVVVTANHFWLDGVVAAALLTAAALVHPRPDREAAPAPVVERRRAVRRHAAQVRWASWSRTGSTRRRVGGPVPVAVEVSRRSRAG